MNGIATFDAILFPADGRRPAIVSLVTTDLPIAYSSDNPYLCNRMPHPEMHMNYIADGGCRSWKYRVVDALDQMDTKFTTPYIIFYPTVSRDGLPFFVNKSIREIQGATFNEARAWYGDIVVAQYCDIDYSEMMDTSIAWYPILKNYFLRHDGP